jgi:hypothetical protein
MGRHMPVLCSAPRRSERDDWRVWDCSAAAVDPAVILGAAEELRLEGLEGIVCKRLDTALRKDAVAEAQPIRDW